MTVGNMGARVTQVFRDLEKGLKDFEFERVINPAAWEADMSKADRIIEACIDPEEATPDVFVGEARDLWDAVQTAGKRNLRTYVVSTARREP